MDHNDERSFGDLIRDARKALGITQTEAASRLGVTQPSYSAWENERAFPTATSAVDLAALLELDLGDLVRSLASAQGGGGKKPEPVG